MGKLTEEVDGELRFGATPPLIVPIEELLPAAQQRRLREGITELLGGYRDSLPDARAGACSTATASRRSHARWWAWAAWARARGWC